jgi:hypothetical protein
MQKLLNQNEMTEGKKLQTGYSRVNQSGVEFNEFEETETETIRDFP